MRACPVVGAIIATSVSQSRVVAPQPPQGIVTVTSLPTLVAVTHAQTKSTQDTVHVVPRFTPSSLNCISALPPQLITKESIFSLSVEVRSYEISAPVREPAVFGFLIRDSFDIRANQLSIGVVISKNYIKYS